MFCNNCGANLQEGSVFCNNCGSAVGQCGAEQEMTDPAPMMPEAPVQKAQAWSDTGNIPMQNRSDTAGIPTQAAVGTQVLERKADPAAGAYGGWYSNEPPAANTVQSAQLQGCKKCGGYIDSSTRRCTGCGKQYIRSKMVIVWAAAAVVVAALAGLNVWQYLKSAEQKDILEKSNAQIMSQEAQLQEKDTIITEKDETIKEQKSEIQNLQDEANDQQANISELESEIQFIESSMEDLYYEGSAYMEKAFFMDDHVVIVPDDGSEVYHKYGCPNCDISMNSFWIYNTQAAISWGYTPCPYCN